jgi:hypothetical protein
MLGFCASWQALHARQRPGSRWPEAAVIRVWIDPTGAPAGAADMVTRAVRTWSGAAGGHFTLRGTTVEREAAIRVSFIQDRSRYGETAPRVDRSGAIVSADVYINGSNAGDLLDQRIILYLTALHELGHAIGLPHTSNFGDIMYAFRLPGDGERYFGAYRRRVKGVADIGTAKATGLSPDDLTALRTLYAR